MKRKRIAVLTAQADEYTQGRFLTGFFEKAYELNYDVCVFSMYLKSQDTNTREVGDSNIFNLVEFQKFDAVVLFTARIRTPGTAEGLLWRLKHEYDGQVLVIDDHQEGYDSLNIDHRGNMEAITDHLIEVHGYRNLIMVDGWKNDTNSRYKREGFLDSLKKHGIDADGSNIRYGNNWYDSGKVTAADIVESGAELPDAIVCASDYIAVGVAAELERRGISVPEQIAVTGYDAVDMNEERIVPLTSVKIPAYEDGRYAVSLIDARVNKRDITEKISHSRIYIGRSCGCEHCGEHRSKRNYTAWDMNMTPENYGSYYNSMMEDLLTQRTYRDFYNTVFQYIRFDNTFDKFSLCMNEYWNVPEVMMGSNALRIGYTKNMYRIIKRSGDDRDNAIDFDNCFDVSELIPELEQDRDNPETYIFTPVNFDDRCFGYAVISCTDGCAFTSLYSEWLKRVMQGMEAFYRQASLQKLLDKVNASQIRDDLTGVYNYNGFLQRCQRMCDDALNNGRQILILSIDMKGLGRINARLGRKTGDDAIQLLANMISTSISKMDVCMRMCNDEFIIASQIYGDGRTYAQNIIDRVTVKAEEFNKSGAEQFTIDVCSAYDIQTITGTEEFDNYINRLISGKNSEKMQEYIEKSRNSELTREEIERDRITADVLDNNLLTYNFQPIVNAKTGQIYAYEVLMRTAGDTYISPLDLIQSAERLGRLNDVERATFLNVLDLVDERSDELAGRKIFLNSIPGCRLSEKDTRTIEEKLARYGGQIVVEFTEEAELDDNTLERLKDKYIRMNVETAIDDYGAGYSNVNNLLRYMPKYVKIDRMLLTNIHEDHQKQHFVKDIIEFAHDNDIVTLAEGVELDVELREAIRLGADLIQGYYTARPSAEAIQEIDKRVITEIVQYNQNEMTRYGKKTYVITDENEISMVQLAFNKYTELDFRRVGDDYKYIEMTGTPGFRSYMLISIGDGFRGELRMNGVSLGGEKGIPCIKIGENCDVRIVLNGDNEFRTGGIQVPETSRLEIAGDGDLRISLAGGRYFGIGNDLTSRHGELIFNQDGTLAISATGMKGIGIGSGLGGEIHINHGRYEIDQRGQEGVVIGCIDNDCRLHIENCDMEIYNGVARSVVIGSWNGSADIDISNISGKISGASTTTSIIGTMYGQHCNVHMQDLNITMNVRANECYGIGCSQGETSINIRYAYVKVIAQGKNAYAMGNGKHTAKLMFSNSDINTQVINCVCTDIGAEEEDIVIGNGRVSFIINGVEKEREVQVVDL